MDLCIEKAGVHIKDTTIFDDISFALSPGTLTSIVGPSGCGKTTLLNCAGLLQKLSSGRIIINGEDATRWGAKKKRLFWRKDAAFIYQDSGVIEDETIFYNVALRSKPYILNKAPLEAQVARALGSVDLSRETKLKASFLSGGEKQRLGIARALYKNATIVFADEPTASLDEGNRNNVIRMLRACVQNGSSVLIATHDMGLANSSDAIIQLA